MLVRPFEMYYSHIFIDLLILSIDNIEWTSEREKIDGLIMYYIAKTICLR